MSSSEDHPVPMLPEEQTPSRFESFVCTCSEEGEVAANALMEEVRRRLGEGTDNLLPYSEEYLHKFLFSAIAMSLDQDFNARITLIGADMWYGVAAETYDESFATWVQCDQVEHGLAATWKAFADHTAPNPDVPA